MASQAAFLVNITALGQRSCLSSRRQGSFRRHPAANLALTISARSDTIRSWPATRPLAWHVPFSWRCPWPCSRVPTPGRVPDTGHPLAQGVICGCFLKARRCLVGVWAPCSCLEARSQGRANIHHDNIQARKRDCKRSSRTLPTVSCDPVVGEGCETPSSSNTLLCTARGCRIVQSHLNMSCQLKDCFCATCTSRAAGPPKALRMSTEACPSRPFCGQPTPQPTCLHESHPVQRERTAPPPGGST